MPQGIFRKVSDMNSRNFRGQVPSYWMIAADSLSLLEPLILLFRKHNHN